MQQPQPMAMPAAPYQQQPQQYAPQYAPQQPASQPPAPAPAAAPVQTTTSTTIAVEQQPAPVQQQQQQQHEDNLFKHDRLPQFIIMLADFIFFCLALWAAVEAGNQVVAQFNLVQYLFGWIVNIILVVWSFICFFLMLSNKPAAVKVNFSLFLAWTIMQGALMIFYFIIIKWQNGVVATVYFVFGIIMCALCDKYMKDLKKKKLASQVHSGAARPTTVTTHTVQYS